MLRLKTNKTVRGEDQMILLSSIDAQNTYYGFEGPFKLSMKIRDEMRKSPSSTRALIFRSIRDGDMGLLQKHLETKPLIFQDDFNATDEWESTALHLACLYNRPEAIELLYKFEAVRNLPADVLAVMTIACQLNRLSVIEALLQHGIDTVGQLMFGVTVLHVIAQFSTVEVAEFIYDVHNIAPPIDKRDMYDITPLHVAAQMGKEDMCRWLLLRGAKAHAMDTRGMTPIMYASTSGYDAVVNLLVIAGGGDSTVHISHVDDESKTALHHAVANGRMQVTQLLLSIGANANAMTHQGSTPLHLCAISNHPDLVSILVRGGAIMEARDLTSNTPLHRACQKGKLDVAIRLIEEGADINSLDDGGASPLFTACCKGHVDTVTKLLTFGADYTLVNHLGRTCLHAAVEQGHLGVVSVLLQKCHRSFMTTKDVMEMNILHIAATKDNKLVDVLVAYDELTDAQDVMGMTPLHHAARDGTHKTVKTLAKVAKDIDIQNFHGKTAFFLACESGNTLSVLALMKMGADIEYRDFFDLNALMMSALTGTTPIVKELLQAGLDVNSTDKKRNTALHYACAKGHLPTVKVLVEYGASVQSMNINGRHPFLEAVQGVHTDVATFLMSHESWKQSLSMCNDKKRMLINDMIRYTPEAVRVMLDKCMQKSNHQPNHKEYEVQFCYSYIDPSPSEKDTHIGHALEALTRYKREDLLSHPVCQSLLMLKWNKFGRYAVCYNFVGHVAFLLLLGIYVIAKPKLDLVLDDEGCNIHATNNNNASLNITEETHNGKANERTWSFYVHIGLYVCLGFSFLKELRFLVATVRHYILTFQNVTMLVALPIITYVIVPLDHELCATHWRLICFALFLLVINNCMMFVRIDCIGLYFSMFFEVARGILKISFLLLFFLLMLSIPFEIMLRHQDGFEEDAPSPLTILAMTLGDLNFRDNIIRGNNNPFTIDTYIIFPIFALILPIIVVNLMIGVAVGDISKIEKEAYLLRMRNQISFLLLVETGLPKALRQRFYHQTHTVRPNDYTGLFSRQVKKWFMNDNCIQFIGKISEADDKEIKEEIKRQNAMIESLKELTLSLHDDLKKLTMDNKDE